MQNNPSQALDSVLRRCAALKTFSEVLEGEALMNALWMLEERDQSADKMTFIGFFGVTAELLGINSNVVTTLYAKLNRNLNLSKGELPEDPMPEMLKFRGIASNSQKLSTDNTVEKKVVSNRKSPAKVKATAEMAVFVSLLTNIASEAGYPKVESYALFKEVFVEEISQAKLEDDTRQQVLSWVDAFNKTVFKRNYTANQLSIIVHCVYIALCEALGPVKADGIMHQAINKTSQLPAAKLYSPKNFL